MQSSRELLDRVNSETDLDFSLLTKAIMAKDMMEIAVTAGGISRIASGNDLAHNGESYYMSECLASDICATYSVVVTIASKSR
jgi:hypothetical protein